MLTNHLSYLNLLIETVFMQNIDLEKIPHTLKAELFGNVCLFEIGSYSSPGCSRMQLSEFNVKLCLTFSLRIKSESVLILWHYF